MKEGWKVIYKNAKGVNIQIPRLPRSNHEPLVNQNWVTKTGQLLSNLNLKQNLNYSIPIPTSKKPKPGTKKLTLL